MSHCHHSIIFHFPSFTLCGPSVTLFFSQFTALSLSADLCRSPSFLHILMPSKQEYHVVIRSDAKHLPEVAKGHWGIRLESEVSIVVGWCQVTALTARQRQRKQRIKPNTKRLINVEQTQQIKHTFNLLYFVSMLHNLKKSPGKEDAFHHFKVLQQHISLRFLA